jgi:hypothetical protein
MANLGVLETSAVGMRSTRRAGSPLEEVLARVQTGNARAANTIDGYFAKQLTYLLHPRAGRMTSPDFAIDDAPSTPGTTRAAAAWRPSSERATRTIAIRLSELQIDQTRAGAGDLRVDALVCTPSADHAPCYRSETPRRHSPEDIHDRSRPSL